MADLLRLILNLQHSYNEELMKITQELYNLYIFTVKYFKDPNYFAPEYLSRNPDKDPEKECDDGAECGKISAITNCHGIKDVSMNNLQKRLKI